MQFVIDPEFKAANRKLTKRERDGLFKAIAEDGVRGDSLVCGQINGDPALYVVDGHNTVEICQEQGINPPSPTVKLFESREDVLNWIHHRARARRNLSQEEMAAERQKRIERVAAARSEGKSTRAIAEQEGVSQTQVSQDLKAATEQGCSVEPEGGKIRGNDDKDRPATKPKLCARCKRVGPIKDCPGCRDLRDKPKQNQSESRKQKPRPKEHDGLPKSVQNALADTWHADCANALANMRKQCKGAFSWSTWLDAGVLDALKAAEEFFKTAIPRKACDECKGTKKDGKEACKRCKGGGYLASQA